MTYCMHFGRNVSVDIKDKSKLELGPLQPSELENANEFLIPKVQSTLVDWKDRC